MSTPADYYDLARVRPEVLSVLERIRWPRIQPR